MEPFKIILRRLCQLNKKKKSAKIVEIFLPIHIENILDINKDNINRT